MIVFGNRKTHNIVETYLYFKTKYITHSLLTHNMVELFTIESLGLLASFISDRVEVSPGLILLPAVWHTLVRSCLLITLIKCLNGHKSLRSLFEGVF